jgi:choline dehydrogenase
MMGRRVTAGNPVLAVLNATKPDGSKRYALTLKTNWLVAKVLFDTTRRNNRKPRATGVEYFVGRSMYAADRRYDANAQGTTTWSLQGGIARAGASKPWIGFDSLPKNTLTT